jgi:hypothetical protein
MSKARAASLILSNSATFSKTRMLSRCPIAWAYELPRRLIALMTIMVLLPLRAIALSGGGNGVGWF